MRNWNWKTIGKAVVVAIFLITLIDISEKLGRIARELSHIESNSAETFKILGRKTVKTEVQNTVDVRVVR